MQREIVLQEEPEGREEVGNDFVKLRQIMRKDCKGKVQEITEAATVSRVCFEPRKSKQEKFKKFLVLILMYNLRYRLQKHLHPNPQSRRILLGRRETLLTHQRITFLHLSLYNI